MEKLAYKVETGKSFDEVSENIEKIFPQRGFRVLAVHNVKETLAEKGFVIEPLKIFEVCNAGFAYKAIRKDVNVAMFMPCKVIIHPDKNGTSITLMRPSLISEMLPQSDLGDLAAEVEKQLIGIIDAIK